MASSPFHGDRPPISGFRRSFTAPHRQLSIHERAGLDKSDADAGVLYKHPSVRIISFAPPNESINSKSSATHADADYPIDTIETLPWRSRTETLQAAGELVIEKVRGSANFLKCQTVVHSILRNSQCWCVDGESKFVLRKGKLQYYRIELPTGTEEEKAKVEQLKEVLGKVLKFEKTPCPFLRAFHVDLPEDGITPRRRGKWQKREGSLPMSPDSALPTLRRTKNFRSWSEQAGSNGMVYPESPLRRESDYGVRRGFVNSPLAAPRPQNARPDTPSSLDSSEDASHRAPEEDYDTDSSANETDQPNHRKVEDDEELPLPESTADEGLESREALLDSSHIRMQEEEPETKIQEPLAEETETIRREAAVEEPAHNGPVEQEQLHVNSDKDLEDRQQAALLADSEPTNQELADQDTIHHVHDNTGADLNDYVQGGSTGTGSSHAEGEDPALAVSEPTILDIASSTELMEPHKTEEKNLPEETTAEANEAENEPRSEVFEVEHDPIEPDVPVSSVAGEDLKSPTIEIENEHPPIPEVIVEPANDIEDDRQSIASTTESFHTVDSLDQESGLDANVEEDLEPTPMAETHDPLGAKRYGHRRDISEVTVTAASFDGANEQDELDRFRSADEIPGRPTTPRLTKSSASDDSWPDIQTPSAEIQDGLRKRLKSHRSLSPLPPTSTVFAPSRQSYGNQLPSDLLQKAARIAIVKPIEMVVLVVHILARIAGGATMNDLLSGNLFKPSDQHRRTSSFPDRLSSHNDDEEDDFGVPIRGRTRSEAGQSKAADTGHDTDADSLFDLD